MIIKPPVSSDRFFCLVKSGGVWGCSFFCVPVFFFFSFMRVGVNEEDNEVACFFVHFCGILKKGVVRERIG
jgi:hypothetical protein